MSEQTQAVKRDAAQTLSLRTFLLTLFVPVIVLLTIAIGLLVHINLDIGSHSEELGREAVQRILTAQRNYANLENLRFSLNTFATTPSLSRARESYLAATALLSESSIGLVEEEMKERHQFLNQLGEAWQDRIRISAGHDDVYNRWKLYLGLGLMIHQLAESTSSDFPVEFTDNDRHVVIDADVKGLREHTERLHVILMPLCPDAGTSPRLTEVCGKFQAAHTELIEHINRLDAAKAAFAASIDELNRSRAEIARTFEVIETRELLDDVNFITELAERTGPVFYLFFAAVFMMVAICLLGFLMILKPLTQISKAIADFRLSQKVPEKRISVPLVEFNELSGWIWTLFRKFTEDHEQSVELSSDCRRLLHVASLDALTGIANRRALDEATARTPRAPAGFGVLMLDLDRFKLINDSKGHIFGDRVLRSLAMVVEHNLPPRCRVYRYGGEEFVVLCPDVTPTTLDLIAESLLCAVRTISRGTGLRADGPVTDPLTVSIGCSSIPAEDDAKPIPALIDEADRALYRAKRNGRDRVEHFSDIADPEDPGEPPAPPDASNAPTEAPRLRRIPLL